ncbi:simple sugar transport system substrate-binding protein/ribose transport system substrate-binding protein [Streptosporangium becharense]|uniref:Simple sugar transport system substrate-binding protein/ribose transport system substrate-binding protein n=1 Tax=Streptosporangium becharense TaxID=1816182 RepID=A0A7W9IB26_9ACTN|nr:substrate-binding domain-containing protein [Streptosporangium becharense]MBB2910734.1 simple sugar transport system substrate-binding protein/ribose transport system substrate-binding protein [Streptosporangium becharense]MBB5817429.1 simple sugar transport system substrate-binding protein/ribose transport system substrate-binding protein [Streptosporangium becharense]
MKKFRSLLTVATVTASVLLAAGCGAIEAPGGTAAAGGDAASGGEFKLASRISDDVKQNKKLVIRLSYHDPSLAFASPIRQGVEKAAAELGVDAKIVGPTGGDANQQVSELQTLINQGQVHGLAVSSASSDALKPVIAQAAAAGIPIISFNTDNPGSAQMAFVGQDLEKSGESEAAELVKLVGDKKGKVVVFSVDTGAGWSHDRFTGFKRGLEGSGLEIVGPVNTGNEPSKAYNTVESTMAAQKDAVAVASLDCCSFTAAAKWIKDSGNTGKIHAVGFDVLPQTVEYLKGGVVDMTISQNPVDQGYRSVKLLVDHLRDGTPIADVDTGAVLVTEDNVDDVPVEG